MDNVKILIVEDELLVAESLKLMLEQMSYHVPAIFNSGKETLENFVPGFADIVIMDIHLKGKINGIETSQGIREISTAPIIYLTDNTDENLRKKAIFGANTVQYLTKPFSKLDIAIAIDLALKAIKKHELHLQQVEESSYLINDCIFVRDRQLFRKLAIGDIILLKAEGSYCKLVYKDERNTIQEILFSDNLSFLEEKLKFAKNLYRVHRSYIINVQYLKKIQENRLWVEDLEIPIGKTYKSDIKNKLHFV